MKIQKLESQLKQSNKILHQYEEEKTMELRNKQQLKKTRQKKQNNNQFLRTAEGNQRSFDRTTNQRQNLGINQRNNEATNERLERIELVETVLNNGNLNDIVQLLETVDPSFILVSFFFFHSSSILI